MNWSTSNLAERKELQGAYKMKNVYRQKGAGNKEVILSKRAGCLLQVYLPLGDGRDLLSRLLH